MKGINYQTATNFRHSKIDLYFNCREPVSVFRSGSMSSTYADESCVTDRERSCDNLVTSTFLLSIRFNQTEHFWQWATGRRPLFVLSLAKGICKELVSQRLIDKIQGFWECNSQIKLIKSITIAFNIIFVRKLISIRQCCPIWMTWEKGEGKKNTYVIYIHACNSLI